MKKTKLNIEIEEEKLNAITIYNKDDDPSLIQVINDTINDHYKAVVPQEVRFYLDSRQNDAQKKHNKSNKLNVAKFTGAPAVKPK